MPFRLQALINNTGGTQSTKLPTTLYGRLVDNIQWFLTVSDTHRVEVGCWACNLIWVLIPLYNGRVFHLNPAMQPLANVVSEQAAVLIGTLFLVPHALAFWLVLREDSFNARRVRVFAGWAHVWYFWTLSYALSRSPMSTGIGSGMTAIFALLSATNIYRLTRASKE